MKRRDFLTKSITGGALLSVAAPVAAQATAPLKLVTTDQRSADAFKTRIETTTAGEMSIEVEAVGLDAASDLLDRVSSGAANLGIVSLDSFLDKNMALGMFASMPFGMTTTELEGWISASEGRDMLDLLGEEYGVSIHLVVNNGMLPMWSKSPIENMSSLSGQKIGSSGLAIQSIIAAGATSVVDLRDPSVNWADLDVLDGVSATEMQEKGLIETFSNLSNANPNKPSAVSALIVNKDTMAAFSETEATILQRACSAELAVSSAMTFHENANIIGALDESAFNAYDLPDDVWSGLNASARTVIEDIFNSGDLQATVVDAYIYFINDVSGWSDVGEAAYFVGRKRLISA
ncbi:MAG: hypothetical protein ABJ327_10295 [Litoreibacter sp.]